MARSTGLRVRAVIALSAFVGSLSLPLLAFGHLTLDDDTACGSVALSALSSPREGAQLQTPKAPAPLDHCALCHWLRAVGGSQTSGVVSTQPGFRNSALVAAALPDWRAGPAVHHLTSRGPPSADSGNRSTEL